MQGTNELQAFISLLRAIITIHSKQNAIKLIDLRHYEYASFSERRGRQLVGADEREIVRSDFYHPFNKEVVLICCIMEPSH